jgi:oxygen-independent coproporphyrinogen-3 oxidase
MEAVLAWSGVERAGDVTIEANPEDVTLELARAWQMAGVTRVSLGVQSFQDRVLQWMHRPHDAVAVPRAVEAIRSAGIASLSIDLIIGVPASVVPDPADDLRKAIDLEPDHLSVYTLTVEPRTPLGKWAARGLIDPAPDERHAVEFLAAHDTLTAAGFEHYEVSNYAFPGRRSAHNTAYWSGSPYLGLGPGAHSFLGGVRSWNLESWVAYERAVSQGGGAVGGRERLTESQRRLEQAYLSLRTAEGAPLDQVAWESDPGQLAIGAGWATVADGRFRLTPEGWLRLDTLAGALTTDTEGG